MGFSYSSQPASFQPRETFVGNDGVNPVDMLREALGNTTSLYNLLAARATQPVSLPDAVVQPLPTFAGGGLPFPIGVGPLPANLRRPPENQLINDAQYHGSSLFDNRGDSSVPVFRNGPGDTRTQIGGDPPKPLPTQIGDGGPLTQHEPGGVVDNTPDAKYGDPFPTIPDVSGSSSLLATGPTRQRYTGQSLLPSTTSSQDQTQAALSLLMHAAGGSV